MESVVANSTRYVTLYELSVNMVRLDMQHSVTACVHLTGYKNHLDLAALYYRTGGAAGLMDWATPLTLDIKREAADSFLRPQCCRGLSI